jgi:hypothetical protein
VVRYLVEEASAIEDLENDVGVCCLYYFLPLFLVIRSLNCASVLLFLWLLVFWCLLFEQEGYTALTKAASMGQLEVVRLLLQRHRTAFGGTDPQAVAAMERKVLEIAQNKGQSAIVQYVKQSSTPIALAR